MLKEYIESHKEEIVTIPMENIVLTSKIHSRGTPTLTDRPSEDLVIVVRQLPEGNYTLVVGWNAYMNAKERDLENIKCIVTKDKRGRFLRRNIKTFSIGKIKIQECYETTNTKPEKIQQRVEYYQQNGEFNTVVHIRPDGMLIDGYATYLAAKQLGLKQVPVRIR